MSYIAETTKSQSRKNDLVIKILRFLGYNVITISQDTKNIKIDYAVFSKGKLIDNTAPTISHRA